MGRRNIIAAQCCTAGGTCRRSVNGVCIAGSSKQLNGAIEQLTYAQTKQRCASFGLELCKQSCSGQGCNYNSHPVFTSLPCTSSPPPSPTSPSPPPPSPSPPPSPPPPSPPLPSPPPPPPPPPPSPQTQPIECGKLVRGSGSDCDGVCSCTLPCCQSVCSTCCNPATRPSPLPSPTASPAPWPQWESIQTTSVLSGEESG